MRSSTKLLAFARRKETREARERPSPRDLLSNIEVLVKEGCERERENGERGESGYIQEKEEEEEAGGRRRGGGIRDGNGGAGGRNEGGEKEYILGNEVVGELCGSDGLNDFHMDLK